MCRRRGAIRSKRSPSFLCRRFHPRRRLRLTETARVIPSNNPTPSLSNHTMKKFSVFPLIAALAFFVSCQKQQTEEERKAEVERQVQDRLAAERMEAEKQRLAQDQASLAAREKALADREAAAVTTPAPVEEPVATAPAPVVTERSEARTEKRSTAAYGMFYEKLDP